MHLITRKSECKISKKGIANRTQDSPLKTEFTDKQCVVLRHTTSGNKTGNTPAVQGATRKDQLVLARFRK